MPANHYQFLSRWRVAGSLEEVSEILGNALDLPRWWPAVYLSAVLLEPGDPQTQLGRRVALHTRGWLPYTLRWTLLVVENRAPFGSTIEADGDFVGRGVWTFRADGDHTEIEFDWRIRADKPLLRWLSFIFKPLFSLNHAWAMARGRESLVRELARRARR